MKMIEEMVRGKSVALVGNAQSLLTQGKAAEIDAHDLVIRINLGLPGIVPAAQIGERTDIWVTARHWGAHVPSSALVLLFMKLTLIGDRDWSSFQRSGLKMPMVRWPAELASECIEFCQCDPGCGLRMLWWLKRKADPSSVSVYGMDCWETPSTWSKKFNTPNHNPAKEREAIDKLCKP